MLSGMDVVGPTIHQALVHRHQQSDLTVQSWLERLEYKRRRSKEFRTLDHREFPFVQEPSL